MSTHWHNTTRTTTTNTAATHGSTCSPHTQPRRGLRSWATGMPQYSPTTPLCTSPVGMPQLWIPWGTRTRKKPWTTRFPGGPYTPPMFINAGRNTSTAPHTPGGRGYFTSTAPHRSGSRGHFTSTAPYTPGGRGYFAAMHQVHINAPYSNTTKRYANWNACFLCGFDLEDNHTSQTCPLHLR